MPEDKAKKLKMKMKKVNKKEQPLPEDRSFQLSPRAAGADDDSAPPRIIPWLHLPLFLTRTAAEWPAPRLAVCVFRAWVLAL